jgi:hypothetical protein
LFIRDDDGDVVFAGTKNGFICTSGSAAQAKFGVRFRGPENCKDSAVPTGQISSGDLFVNANTVDGSLDLTGMIRCRR